MSLSGSGLGGFGIREFQLYILAFMPYSERMADALAMLDATVGDTKISLESAKEIGLADIFHKVDLEFSALGDPAFNEYPDLGPTESFIGVEGSKSYGFVLPVFPDYVYFVNVAVNNFAWGHRFARWPGAACPRIDAVEDLQTWKYLKDEFLEAVAGATWVDGFSYNDVYAGRMVERRTGELVDVLVGFDVGLLQWVQRAGAEAG